MEIVAGVARPTAGAPVIIEKMNQGRGDRRRLRGLSAVGKKPTEKTAAILLAIIYVRV